MRITFVLITLLSLPIAIFGKDIPYSGEAERKAVRSAYELLRVYYPDGLCVSDSVYDLEWHYFPYTDRKTREELRDKLPDNCVRNLPCRSKNLNRVFHQEQGCGSGCDYVAMFAEPYKGMIRCEVRATGKTGAEGPGLAAFLFRFREDKGIYQVNRASDSILIHSGRDSVSSSDRAGETARSSFRFGLTEDGEPYQVVGESDTIMAVSSRDSMSYSDKAVKTAVKSACGIIKVFYPDSLCVSDSIHDIYWNPLSGVDEATWNEVYLLMLHQISLSEKAAVPSEKSHRIEYERPAILFSEEFNEALDNHTCKECKSGYEAMFGMPYKGMLMCEVWPWHRRVGLHGGHTIDCFFFRFDNEGVIYQATKSTIIFD